MWPDMRLPGNTRPGVWRWPIEPGRAVRRRESPWLAMPPAKLWRFMTPAIALADRGAGDVDDLAYLEQVDLELGARLEVRAFALGEAEFDQLLARQHLGFA